MVSRYYLGGNTQTAMDYTKSISFTKPGAGTVGTGTVQNLAHVLNSIKVPTWNAAQVAVGNVLATLQQFVTPKTPGIAGLAITVNTATGPVTYKHLTVAIQAEPDGTIIFLDPYPGVGVVEVAPGGTYSTSAGVAAFDGWVLCTKPH